MARTVHGFIYLGLGAALMYLMDPQQGRKRRNDLANRLDSTRRKVRHGTDLVLRDATNRTHGVLVQTRQWLRSQRERLENRASNDPSVSPGMGPAIGAAKNALAPWMRERWSPAQRALAGMVGAGLATSGYVRGGFGGLVMTMAGIGLVARAGANERLGVLAHGKGFSVDRTIRVDAPVEEVFAYWRNLEHFPRWMSHVREVRALGGERYHWAVDGPAGAPVEWDSELTGVRENRALVPGFFASCRAYFFRFFRLALVTGLLYVLLLWLIHPWAAVLMLAAANIVFDYAKVRTVVENRRSVLVALGAAWRFIRKNPASAIGVYLLDVLLFAIVLGVYGMAAPSSGGNGVMVWPAFAIGQAYILARLAVRMIFFATEAALVQGQ